MTNKYFNGEILPPVEHEDIDDELIKLALDTSKRVEERMETLRVSDAIDEIFTLLRRSNKYIDETSPWVLGKDESKKKRLGTVLYNLLESIRIAAVLLEPFLPETAKKIYSQLNTNKTDWESLQEFNGIIPGDKVGTPEILFARIDVVKKIEEINKHLGINQDDKKSKESSNKKEVKEVKEDKFITIDDFDKIDLRVAEVVKAEKHPDADKLLILQLKLGEEVRQVVSGIAKYYEPEDLIGKKVVMVYNLQPVTLRGVDSYGMILAAQKGKKLTLVSTLEDLASGAKIS
jgi:methionyl-tRNA synthetase